MDDAIEIDGSVGEGGGQVLRTSLTLSILTQQPVHIRQIRAKRPKPGLMAQHLQAKVTQHLLTNASIQPRLRLLVILVNQVLSWETVC
jgi:RNA 3'-terminal phosphate cyclase (ATP)